MEKGKLKIALSGPSGLGKSTLCKAIAKHTPAEWLSTSAGHILTSEDKENLEVSYGYKGAGHKAVINLSSQEPEFGKVFQELIRLRRAQQIFGHNKFVIDRCPIDNVAYMLSQVGHNVGADWVDSFIANSIEAYQELTHVIQLRYSADVPPIEDSGTEPNSFFQKHSSDIFTGVYARYFANIPGPQVITIDFWDLEDRVRLVKSFLTGSQQQLKFREDA